MKQSFKLAIKHLLQLAVTGTGKTSVGRYLYEQITYSVMLRTQSISHQGTSLKFATPNQLNKFRVDTFSTKEPETLEWIDRMADGSVVWDIGANVGLYACYAAKRRGCRVFAFEPSVFNLELLARNIWLNQLTEKVTIIPLALSNQLVISKLNMTATDWGGPYPRLVSLMATMVEHWPRYLSFLRLVSPWMK